MGGACDCKKELFDPAPEADEFRFGHAEIFSWVDSGNVEWKGILLYPPDYVASKRYPLVIQTHGARHDQFLLMGPNDQAGVGTAFAAQPLANAGMVVLQALEPSQLLTHDEREGPAIAEGWHAAIQKLTELGICDPDRVGLISFSRTGFYLVHLLAKYPYLLLAANISDSVQPGYFQRVLTVNLPKTARDEAMKIDGAQPTEIGFGEYFAHNPLYRLGKTSTAMRIEALGPDSVIAMAETYEVLRDAGRPVDLVYFPLGSHNLLKPLERLASQQGNVDWFRFWLQGQEDPDRDKQGQYQRWRGLKSLQTQALTH
jgi:hypothetical protein